MALTGDIWSQEEYTSTEERSISDASLKQSLLEFDFIENLGQWQGGASYYGRNGGLDAWFEEDRLRFDISKRERFDPKEEELKAVSEIGHSWDMVFEGKQDISRLVPYDERITNYNYLIGEEEDWVTCAKGYSELRYLDIYPKTDLRFYSRPEGLLEFDFILHPGASLDNIQLRYEGLNDLTINADGSLELWTSLGNLNQHIPACYQTIDGEIIQVKMSFKLIEDNLVGFELEGNYNPAFSLILDPALTYSTFVSCSDCDGYVLDMTINAAGELYYGGYDQGALYPVSTGAYDTVHNASAFFDAVVGKMSGNGRNLLYATYLGGERHDYVYGIGVSNSEMYLAGFTYSSDFPSVAGAYDLTYNGTATSKPDAFFAKLNTTGTNLLYSSFFGGTGEERLYAASFDKTTGYMAGTGYTRETGMPTSVGAFQDTIGADGNYDAYVVIFSMDGGGASDLIYSTYLGGTTSDQGWAIHWDKQGDLWVGGLTFATDFPTTTGAISETHINSSDAFLVNIDPAGGGTSDLLYSTYLGGTSQENVTAISSDWSDSIYVAGYTYANNFPTVNAYDAINGLFDQTGFIMKIDPSSNGASDIIWSTYFGGTSKDEVNALMVSDAGRIAVISQTESTNFPTTATGYDLTHNGNYDLALSVLSNNGQTLSYSTYLGGAEDDYVQGGSTLGVKNGNLFLGGTTHSADFPTYPTAGSDTAYQKTKVNGTDDTHVLALFGNLPLPIELMSFDAEMQGGGVLLEWATAQEIDNAYFEVQRSVNGLDFQKIGRIDAFGTIEVRQDYSLLDRTAPVGTVYYRLKQVDIDGYFEFSKVRSVNVNAELLDLWISPNPARGTFAVNGADFEDIVMGIYSPSGARIPFNVSNENGKLYVNIEGRRVGFAIVELNRSGARYYRKVVLH